MDDHHAVAKQTSLDFYYNTPPESAEIYLQYGDCSLAEEHCSLPLAEHTPAVVLQVREGFAQWCGNSSHDSTFPEAADSRLRDLLHTRLFPSRGGEFRNKYCRTIRGYQHNGMQHEFGIPIPAESVMAVPARR